MTRAADTPSGVAPEVSVIIPHYNDLERLAACLGSLSHQSLDPASYEIIVVDNGSPCGFAAVESAVAGRAILLEEREKGAGPARNAGVAAARGRALAFIDADCIAEPQWLAEGLAGLSTFDIVGGSVRVSAVDPLDLTGPEAFEAVFAFDIERYISAENFTITGNLFVPRELFLRVGPFRNGVSEDKDWCHRAIALGYSLGYRPAAAIAHPARHCWDELRSKWRRINRETYALTRERRLGTVRWLARTYLLPLSIIPHGLRILGSPKLAGPRNRLRGLRTLGSLRLWRFADSHRLLFDRRIK